MTPNLESELSAPQLKQKVQMEFSELLVGGFQRCLSNMFLLFVSFWNGGRSREQSSRHSVYFKHHGFIYILFTEFFLFRHWILYMILSEKRKHKTTDKIQFLPQFLHFQIRKHLIQDINIEWWLRIKDRSRGEGAERSGH